jgi:hypothetical protein
MFGKWFKKSSIDVPPLDQEATSGTRPGEIYTGTATIVLFDLAALKHRLTDDCDWWADPTEELRELRERNLLILGLQADGHYDVDISTADGGSDRSFSLKLPSGRLFVGPGEEITGEGNEPTGEHGGFFVPVEPGDNRVGITRRDDQISVRLVKADAFENSVTEPVIV